MPTAYPTVAPGLPTMAPTAVPTPSPTAEPTAAPSFAPRRPTAGPTVAPGQPSMEPTLAPSVAPGENQVSISVDVTLLGISADTWNTNSATAETSFKTAMREQCGAAGTLTIAIKSVTPLRSSRRSLQATNPGDIMKLTTQVSGAVTGGDDTTISNSLVRSVFDNDFTTALRASASIFQGVTVSSIMPTPPAPAPGPADTASLKATSPAGAIAGGVVGGLALLVIIYVYHKRSAKGGLQDTEEFNTQRPQTEGAAFDHAVSKHEDRLSSYYGDHIPEEALGHSSQDVWYNRISFGTLTKKLGFGGSSTGTLSSSADRNSVGGHHHVTTSTTENPLSAGGITGKKITMKPTLSSKFPVMGSVKTGDNDEDYL